MIIASPNRSNSWLVTVVGFGDGAYEAITLGMGDLDDVRWLLGLDYTPSDEIVYGGAQTIGNIEGGAALGGSSFVRGGWLNSNRYLRIGVGKHEGYKWIRIGGEWVRTESKHIDLFRIGRWP